MKNRYLTAASMAFVWLAVLAALAGAFLISIRDDAAVRMKCEKYANTPVTYMPTRCMDYWRNR